MPRQQELPEAPTGAGERRAWPQCGGRAHGAASSAALRRGGGMGPQAAGTEKQRPFFRCSVLLPPPRKVA